MLRTRMRLAGAVIIAALLLALVQGAAAQDGPDQTVTDAGSSDSDEIVITVTP